MTPNHVKLLLDKHPLFAVGGDQPTCRYDLDGIAVGDGWFAILDEMVTRIEQRCADAGVELPQVLQIKEKMGLLRVYVRSSDPEVLEIVAGAEGRSGYACEVCGAPGSLRRGGWLRTRCDLHAAP